MYCYSGKKTSHWDWPEPPRIIALIHQNIDQRSEWEREGKAARSSRRVQLHVGLLSLFHSSNWLLLRKRRVFPVPVSLRLCLPLFLRLAVSFSRAPPSRRAALPEQQLWKTPFADFKRLPLFHAFFFNSHFFFLSCCYLAISVSRFSELRPCSVRILCWKSVGYPGFVASRSEIIIPHCGISMTNKLIYLTPL